MKNFQAVWIAAGLVLLAFFIYLQAASRGGNEASIRGILKKYKFTELTPPSTLVPPGTLITITQDDPLVVGVVCSPSESLSSAFDQKLIRSASSNSKEALELTATFKMDAEARKQATAKIESTFVKNISITLTDVKLIEIPDDAVLGLVAHRTEDCQNAVKLRRGNGQKISMIKSVMQATATYKVEFTGSADTAARMEATRKVAASLGLGGGVKSNDTIQGDNLYWGVRDDELLANVSANTPPPTGAAPRSSILPIDRKAKIVEDSP